MRTCFFTTCLAVAVSAGVSFTSDDALSVRTQPDTRKPPAELIAFHKMQAGGGLSRRQDGEPKPTSVDVVFHILRSKDGQKQTTDSQVQDSMKELNDAFKPVQISFNLVNQTYTVNENWATYGDKIARKKALRQGDKKTLNIYGLEKVLLSSDSNTTMNGKGSYPQGSLFNPDEVFNDSVELDIQVLKGGARYIGGSVVHEVGHWFGLLHTFEGGCKGFGDGVDDTPPEADAHWDCKSRSSCPGFQDSIHNFMSYTENCRKEFTPGQITRMHDCWNTFRGDAAPTPQPFQPENMSLPECQNRPADSVGENCIGTDKYCKRITGGDQVATDQCVMARVRLSNVKPIKNKMITTKKQATRRPSQG